MFCNAWKIKDITRFLWKDQWHKKSGSF